MRKGKEKREICLFVNKESCFQEWSAISFRLGKKVSKTWICIVGWHNSSLLCHKYQGNHSKEQGLNTKHKIIKCTQNMSFLNKLHQLLKIIQKHYFSITSSRFQLILFLLIPIWYDIFIWIDWYLIKLIRFTGFSVNVNWNNWFNNLLSIPESVK